MKKIIAYSLCVLLVFATSCKKKEETTVVKYLNGTLIIDGPTHVLYGSSVHYTPGGIKHPDGKTFGYSFSMTPHTNMGEKADTVLHIVKQPGDSEDGSMDFLFEYADSSHRRALSVRELATYTLTYKTLASDYSASICTKTITTVWPGHDEFSSLQIENFEWDDLQYFKDTRDGTEYPYRRIGNDDWFFTNLAYFGNDIKGEYYYFSNAPVMGKIYGGYYTRKVADKVCPTGWHLPSDNEFLALVTHLSGMTGLEVHNEWLGVADNLMCKASFNGVDMWEFWPGIKIPENPMFAALPIGFGTNPDSKLGTAEFKSDGVYSSFWISDTADDLASFRYLRYNNCNNVYLGTTTAEDSMVMNVRCVRNN